MTDYGDLHIIDLGANRPSRYRWALGTAEPHPDGRPGRWVRVYAKVGHVKARKDLPRIVTGGLEEIIEVEDQDEVTG